MPTVKGNDWEEVSAKVDTKQNVRPYYNTYSYFGYFLSVLSSINERKLMQTTAEIQSIRLAQ